jgi:hypothetical protein
LAELLQFQPVCACSANARPTSNPTSAEKPHPLNSGALLAAILDNVVAITVGRAFLDLHCLFAKKATQEINQRAFIIVQMKSFSHACRP